MKISLTFEDVEDSEDGLPRVAMEFNTETVDENEVSAGALTYAVSVKRLFESGDLTRILPQVCADILEKNSEEQS